MTSAFWMPKIDETMTGNAWRFEGVLDVDWELCPVNAHRKFNRETTKKLTYFERLEALRPYAMQPLDPDFYKKVQRGDFLIGGESTGYGNDHDHPCVALRGAGVAAVICEGTNANFHRNAIHNGLPVVVIPGIMSAVKTGDKLEVNIVKGWVKNVTNGKEFTFKPFPEFILAIMRDGGLYPWMRRTPSSTSEQTSSAT